MRLPRFFAHGTDTRLSPKRGARALAVRAITLLALCTGAAQAQITIDNTSSTVGDTSALRFSHTVNPGSNALLMVGVEVHAKTTVDSVEWGSGSATCSATCNPASCFCPLTQVGTVTDSGKNVTVQLWKLLNPPAGTGDIVITLPSNHHIISGATSFFGVNHTVPLGTAASTSADAGSPASVKVVSTAGAVVLDALGTSPNTTPMVTGTAQTQLYSASLGTGSAGVTGAGSTRPGAATVTMSWSVDSPNWAIIAVPINPAPTPIGGSPTPTPTISVSSCSGDCDHSGTVSVDELLTLVNIALGNAELSTCLTGDANHDDEITSDEIVAAVIQALDVCPSD